MPPYYPCRSQERARATTPASPTNYYLYGAVLLNSSIMVAMRDPLQLRVASGRPDALQDGFRSTVGSPP
eukprot:8560126-Pyramimonas_sp.AAC.1